MATLHDALKSLAELRNLPEGWRFGEGGPPTEKAYYLARKYLVWASRYGVEVAEVFPTADRGIMIGFYDLTDDHDIEITFEPDGTITFAEDRLGEQVDYIETIQESQLLRKICEFQAGTENLFVSSIRETITQRKSASSQLLSKYHQMVQESPSSMKSVERNTVVPSVRIFTTTTESSPEIPHFSGELSLNPI